MTTQSFEDESDIAAAAARILSESFLKAASTETVLYVKDDAIWSKSPNGDPVLIKQLSGRNPNLAKKITGRGTYKIKKIKY
ncbi:hypothetical protein F971_00806 [Acinetobacter vivianii]|uniref:Uncharacterized protein n=1 Tax=Acinetobacter vivianii TaxID=1776742 RepID=N8W9I6_9GAMM|nr:hypothetical protein [Acinetobacter vivianii]ENU93548.1 hypothetical protein F971_00806 [Acinetobacter vivianii]